MFAGTKFICIAFKQFKVISGQKQLLILSQTFIHIVHAARSHPPESTVFIVTWSTVNILFEDESNLSLKVRIEARVHCVWEMFMYFWAAIGNSKASLNLNPVDLRRYFHELNEKNIWFGSFWLSKKYLTIFVKWPLRLCDHFHCSLRENVNCSY